MPPRAKKPKPAPVMTAEVAALVDLLRARETDSAFKDAPVLDVYGRISNNPETGETEKVDRQLEDTLKEVLRRKARLGAVLRDDGRSAWSLTAKRPDWDELLLRLEKRVSSGVIAWHTDRLMRQPKDLERLIGFGDAGLMVGSCHGDYDLANSDDRFTLRILTAAAAKSSDDTSRRQKRKAQALRERGERFGGPRPFGLPGSQAGETIPDEQVQAEREAIAWGAKAHLDGKSLTDIAAEWNERGLRTFTGQEFEPRGVADTLRHPRIAGLLSYEKAIVGRLAGVEPMITLEEYEALQAKFVARRRGRPVIDSYLMSGGLLLCAVCTLSMSGKSWTTKEGYGVRFYACRKRKMVHDGRCGKVSINVAAVDAEVRDMVIRILSDPRHGQQIARQSAKLAQSQATLDAAEADATELARRLGEGHLKLKHYDAAIAPLNARIARLQNEVDALREAGADQANQAATRAEITTQWENATIGERRIMIRRVAPRGIIVKPATPQQRGPHKQTAARLEIL